MANPEHVEMLKDGVGQWNLWRKKKGRPTWAGRHKGNIGVDPDLSGVKLYRHNLKNADLSDTDLRKADLSMAHLVQADLKGADLEGANLNGADLTRANLSGANLKYTDFSWANLTDAKLNRSNFTEANLNNATLSNAECHGAIFCNAIINNADLSGTDLTNTDFTGSHLQKANLSESLLSNSILVHANCEEANFERSVLVKTKLNSSNFSNCKIYGISAWELELIGTNQENLIITEEGEPIVSVDNLEVAQFVYLLLHNEKIRSIIETIGQKGVLILGRFTPERKAVLDAIRNKLRLLGFVPMMFDFEKPTQHDFTETIKTLAALSRFIIADITNPKSAPLELQATMPNYMIPFVPIIHENEEPFAMFRDLKQKYGEWVLDLLEYDSAEGLIDVLNDAVVQPALDKAYELIDRKAEDLKKRHVKDYKKKPDIR